MQLTSRGHRKARRRATRRALLRHGQPVPRSSQALRALTAGAMALPGLAGSIAADSPPERIEAAYSYSHYREDSLPVSSVGSGSTERLVIDAHQFSVVAPVTERTDIGLDIVYETMSGASPIFVRPDANGDPVTVMSQATIEESRTDALLRGSYYFDDASLTLGTGVSVENDYLAFNGSIKGERNSRDKNMTVSGGMGFSIDSIEPTDAELFGRVKKEDKRSFNAFGGMSHIITRNSVVQSTISFEYASGFLSDPYKQVSIGPGNEEPDSRPDVRNRMSWLTRYRHHFGRVNGSFHGDYQLYVDDWGITAHSFDLAWYQGLFEWFRLIPSFRYYSQGQADFYANFFNGLPATGFASSDYRLSAFGAISVRLKAEAFFRTFGYEWRTALTYERYKASGDYGFKQVDSPNPALVAYHLGSFTLSGRF